MQHTYRRAPFQIKTRGGLWKKHGARSAMLRRGKPNKHAITRFAAAPGIRRAANTRDISGRGPASTLTSNGALFSKWKGAILPAKRRLINHVLGDRDARIYPSRVDYTLFLWLAFTFRRNCRKWLISMGIHTRRPGGRRILFAHPFLPCRKKTLPMRCRIRQHAPPSRGC